MMKKKIPQFHSKEEAALFWENHEILDYIEPNEFKIIHPRKHRQYSFTNPYRKPTKELISIRIDSTLLERAKKMAHQIKVGYQSVLRGWLEKGASLKG